MAPEFNENGATSTPGAPRVWFSIDFMDCVPRRKIVVFPMAFWAAQKIEKLEHWRAKGSNSRSDHSPSRVRVGGFGIGWPQGRPRANGQGL